jgi:hypothetical protein
VKPAGQTPSVAPEQIAFEVEGTSFLHGPDDPKSHALQSPSVVVVIVDVEVVELVEVGVEVVDELEVEVVDEVDVLVVVVISSKP